MAESPDTPPRFPSESTSLVCCFEGCGKVFSRPSKLERHHSDHTGEKPFNCSYEGCDRTFTRRTHVKRHELTHKEEKPFACTEEGCDRRFYTKQHLNRHIQTHSVAKTFACTKEGCNAAFAKRNQLKVHISKHTGAKPYPCEYIDPETSVACPLGFQYPSQLKRHQKLHEKIPKFFCGVPGCEKQFLTGTALQGHHRMEHTPKQEFACLSCPKSFPTRTRLKLHEKTHEVHFDFVCPECGKDFANARSLKAHQQTHNLVGERPACLLCSRTFCNKYSLARHSKNCKVGAKRELNALDDDKKEFKVPRVEGAEEVHNKVR